MFYNLFHSPALFVKSSRDSAMGDVEPARPFTKSVSFSVVGQKSRFAGVLALLHGGRPFTVRRPSVRYTLFAVAAGVIAVVVFAFNAVLRRRLIANIGKEVWKRTSPMLAYAYSSSAMPVISSVVRVVASRPHLLPGSVFWRLVPASSARSVTSARLNRLPSEISTIHGRRISALAETLPSRITALGIASKLDHHEFAVLTANFISAVFAASARLDASMPNGTTVKNLLNSAFTAEQPVCSSLASEISPGVANGRKIAEWLPSDVFDVGASDSRIIHRHDSTPIKLDCDIEPDRSTTTA